MKIKERERKMLIPATRKKINARKIQLQACLMDQLLVTGKQELRVLLKTTVQNVLEHVIYSEEVRLEIHMNY